MQITDTTAMLDVGGGELHLRRPPGGPFWEFNFYERYFPTVGLTLPYGRLVNHPFHRRQFRSLKEAATIVGSFVGGDAN